MTGSSYESANAFVVRAYNGNLYGKGKGTRNAPKLREGNAIRFQWNAATGDVALSVDSVNCGIVFTAVTVVELYPAIFSYGANAEASIVEIEHGAAAATRPADGLSRVLDELRSGDAAAKQHACTVLLQLAGANAEQRTSIGGAPGCITTLCAMLRSAEAASQTKALSVLRQLAQEAKIREAILMEDYAGPVVKHLGRTDSHAVQADAADTIGTALAQRRLSAAR